MVNYALKGFVEKLNLNLWDGFHDTLIDVFTKGENADTLGPVMGALPFYLLTMTGKVDLKLD